MATTEDRKACTRIAKFRAMTLGLAVVEDFRVTVGGYMYRLASRVGTVIRKIRMFCELDVEKETGCGLQLLLSSQRMDLARELGEETTWFDDGIVVLVC